MELVSLTALAVGQQQGQACGAVVGVLPGKNT